jgi:hypothetical protein
MFILREDVHNRERMKIKENCEHWFPRPDDLLHLFDDLVVQGELGTGRKVAPQNIRIVICRKPIKVSMRRFSQRTCQPICKLKALNFCSVVGKWRSIANSGTEIEAHMLAHKRKLIKDSTLHRQGLAQKSMVQIQVHFEFSCNNWNQEVFQTFLPGLVLPVQ